VKAGTGHFERHEGKWRVKHANSESGMAKDMQEIMKANNELAAENAALKAELKQEQEDQSEMLLIAHLDGLTKNREAHAKELAAQAERIAKLEEAAAEDIAMLRELSSALGAGAGDDTTTADQLRKRILSSAEIHYGAGRVRGRADASVIVEELSKTPNTTWGEIVRAIRSTEPRNE
jgi:hypothetical protein